MSEKRKLTQREFVLRAIEKLDGPPPKEGVKPFRGKVIHTVYSEFNKAFRNYFDGEDPVVFVDKLAEEGVISKRMVKGGAFIALPGVLMPRQDIPPEETLGKMGL